MKPHRVPVAGDLLTPDIADPCEGQNDCDAVVMAQVADEAEYVPRHSKKTALVLTMTGRFATRLGTGR